MACSFFIGGYMNTTPGNQQDDKDQKLLLGLLLTPIKRPTRSQRINAFFSHPAWQSAGTIIGFLSLIVTCTLTIYIFNFTQRQASALRQQEREQQTANIVYALLSEKDKNINGYSDEYDNYSYLAITNTGPAIGQEFIVSVSSSDEIECKESVLSIPHTIRSLKITKNPVTCNFYYDHFYIHYSAFIAIRLKSGILSTLEKKEITGKVNISTSGGNIVTTLAQDPYIGMFDTMLSLGAINQKNLSVNQQ